MFALRVRKLRTFLVTLSVALMAVLVSQSAIATVNQAQHSLTTAHPAGALGGQVHFDHDHHVEHQVSHDERQISGADDLSTDGPSHHHHGDGPQIAPIPREHATSVILAQPLSLRAPRDAPPSSGMILGLERPPKPSLEVFA